MISGTSHIQPFLFLLIKVCHVRPGSSLSTRVTAEDKKRQNHCPQRTYIEFGFIHLSPTAPNRVENFTFKNVSLVL